MAERNDDDGIATASNAGSSQVPGPSLLGLQLALSPHAVGIAGLGVAACLAAALAIANGWFEAPPRASPATGSAHNPAIVRLTVAETPGFLQAIDPAVANGSPHVFAMLMMPETEKARLRRALEESTTRLGAITVWDNMVEDGDTIRIAAAGFTQEVLILHKPKSFFVPYLPGGSVRIEGVHDGGGGITLGVRTALGPLPLPPLSVGQIVEIALP